eukprot:308151-Pyramimonas_sp.AAC.1
MFYTRRKATNPLRARLTIPPYMRERIIWTSDAKSGSHAHGTRCDSAGSLLRAPITLQGREYAWRGSQSYYRGGNMPGGGANHITGGVLKVGR